MDSPFAAVDWLILGLYGLFAIGLGLYFARRQTGGASGFFVGDRRLPWWLAGTSMVATTFAADTPLAVTGIVALGGISGNWLWWSWGIAHVVSTFFFARLWRRSGVITDAEITELRYSGRAAAGLRGFKAVYFGLFINCLTMGWVIAAMVKISRSFFTVDPGWVIAACVLVSITYTTLGGFRSVVVTDLVQFALGMAGAIALAVIAVRSFGGIGSRSAGGEGLLPAVGEALEGSGRGLGDVLEFIPGGDHPTTTPIFFIVLLLAGWWRYAEGNGYLVQRFAACRDEGEARAASLWFSVAHNALRPWPWILVALAALVIYPLGSEPAAELRSGAPDGVRVRPAVLDVATGGRLTIEGVPPGTRVSIEDRQAILESTADGSLIVDFAGFSQSGLATVRLEPPDGAPIELAGLSIRLTDREMAYPLLARHYLPPGLLGLVVASLLAAFMSTIDTHVNWGSSYLMNDLYQRFLRPTASERELLLFSRATIVLLAILAGLSALVIRDIAEVYTFLVTLGAGLGSVSAARWYWSRVTPHAELAALAVTTLLAVGLQLLCTPTLFGSANPWFLVPVERWLQILIIAGASLATWIPVALLGPQNDGETLKEFARRVRPAGPGWSGYADNRGDADGSLTGTALQFIAGLVIVFGTLFGFGYLILGPRLPGLALLVVALGLLLWLARGSGEAGAEST